MLCQQRTKVADLWEYVSEQFPVHSQQCQLFKDVFTQVRSAIRQYLFRYTANPLNKALTGDTPNNSQSHHRKWRIQLTVHTSVSLGLLIFH